MSGPLRGWLPPSLPVEVGDVVLEDICGTGVDMVATKSVLASDKLMT